MMPNTYGGIDLGQHWLRQWLVAWWHQAITWTNVDLSSNVVSGIHLRAILHEMLKIYPRYEFENYRQVSNIRCTLVGH